MYAGDHLPPHVHVRMRDGREVLVELHGLTVLRGTVPMRALHEALAWVRANHVLLTTQWRTLNP